MCNSLYERVFEHTTAPLAIHEPENGRFAAINPAYANALEYEPAELEGRSLLDLIEGDPATLSRALENAQGGGTARIETALTDGNGTEREVSLELDAITVDGRSQPISNLDTVADRRHGSDRSSSERRLEMALAGTDTGVWEWDMATDEVIWTESMEELFGLDHGTFEGTFDAFADRVHPDDLAGVETAIGTAIERDEMFETEYRIERDDGEERWVQARGELQDATEGTGRMIGIVTDITDLKHTERSLRRQKGRYRQLVKRLPDAYYTIDDEWRVTFCNQGLADRLGMRVEEIRGERAWDIFPEARDTVIEHTIQRVKETGSPETFEYRYETGEQWVRIQVYPHDDGIAAISTDITQQREALLSILDSTPIVLYRLDGDGVFQEVRGEFLSELGLEPEDLIGERIFDAYADNELVTTEARRALDGEPVRYSLTLGDVTLRTQYTPIYTDGEVTGAIGVSMDVTELQRQRERMEFFNSILRHDVLNGMTVIKMRAELLADELEGDQQQYAKTIVDWCNTTTEVTKRVRRVVETLTTPDEEHRLGPTDVSSILSRKVHELEHAYPDVTFEGTIPDGVRVRADELLSDVLGNVLTNGIKHNDTEDLRMKTTVEVDGETVRIRIADDGVGIADDRKTSIFRRGETSHAKETGSGFGLFFVDVMVEKYGGRIRVEDAEDGGARFVIELSAVEGPR